MAYHIIISSEEAGTILDQEVDSFYALLEFEGRVQIRKRWDSEFGLYGAIHWAAEIATEAIHQEDSEIEPLADGK